MTRRIEFLLGNHALAFLVLLLAAPAVGQVAAQTADTSNKPVVSGTSATSEQKASLEDVQAKLDAALANNSLEATHKERLVASYRATLEALRASAADTERIAKFAKAAALAADKLTVAREQLKQAAPTFSPPEGADRLTIEELRQRRSESETALASARQTAQMLESSQREREAKRAQLPKLIAEARAALEVADQAPVPEVEDDPQGTLRAAREAERAAKLAAMKQNIDALTQEQATIDSEAELLPAQIEVAKRELAQAEQQLRFWSETLGRQKQFRIESDLAEHREQLESANIPPDRSMVLRLQDQWIEVLHEQSQLERKLTREQSRYAELLETYKATKEEIEKDIAGGRGLRSGLGQKLQVTRNRLPTSSDLDTDIRAIDDLIDRGQTLQTDLELALEDLNGDASGTSMRPISLLPMRDGVVDPNEVSLLKRMKADIEQHLNTLIELKGELELKRKVVSDIRELIESHVVWIRNAPAYQLSDFSTAWQSFRWIVHPAHVKAVWHALLTGLVRRLDLIVIWAVLGLSLWCVGSRLRRRLYKVGEVAQFGSQGTDSQDSLRPTLTALAITVTLAIPPVATLAVIGYAILEAAEKDHFLTSVGSAFLMVAVALFPMETLRQMLRPGGLAIAHFGYRSEIVMPPRTALRLLIDLGLPMLLVWRIANAGRAQMDASLGRLIFSVGMLVLSYLLWQSLHPKSGLLSDYLTAHPQSWAARLKRLWHPLFSLLPLGLAALAMFGYSYTATLFTGKLYWTLWLGIGVLVSGGLLRRWFETYRRRLAASQRPVKVTEPLTSEVGTIEVPQEAPIDIAEMNAQSLRLIQALMWLAGLVGMVLIWAPVFPAVRLLDHYELWHTQDAQGELAAITLTNLVIAIPIVLLSLVAVRNVPGLLETILLERLPLDRPARYAITTLASYALAVIGIMMFAKTLGLRWEGIQWLVAALGVGLGFGLQEIFANFVSGLILLFEQPIRVGDVVTIDGVTGTVSRIRIRATAVTNYDRQELIIPNKDLITGRLINWTLTDSTNRLVLNIGIAYGSDTRKACGLLEQICAQHQNLLVDPPPVVTFEAFGDSTLNIVIRCYLGALDQRLKTIHELNTTINERFQQEQIEIAFPQRDLHIRSMPPQFAAAFAPKAP